ncbi:MAG: aldehyde dehydrogenase family protein [Phycisphaerales bacterium]
MSNALFTRLGIANHPRLAPAAGPETVSVTNPATGEVIAHVRLDDAAGYERAAAQAVESFRRWRSVPAPIRGQMVRAMGDLFRSHKRDLGELVSLEVGKIRAEGEGEIQEIVDICDFAVGLSRQLPGLTIPSERAAHRMMEQWLPLGPIGVISAFNFPAAVWAWNSALAAVCGDSTLWKPSLLAPLTALACTVIAEKAASAAGCPGLFPLIIGQDAVVGERMIADKRLPLISATGSCRMGKHVGQVVAGRLGRALLELGGNNACIITESADLSLALPSVVFGSVGTAGQRCTTTRRLIVHESVVEGFTERLTKAYQNVQSRIGDPLKEGTLVGPLVNARAVEGFERAVRCAREQGATVLVGGKRVSRPGNFVEPTLIRAPAGNVLPIAFEETFAPILYVFSYRDLDDALALHNSVDQGLASAIFTEKLRDSERFLAVDGSGSDCGLAYVNLGTSGAEIGGAFGGEKETGGGRESGSDSWKAYMRRQSCTVNYSGRMELAQGIRFE